MDVCEDVSGGLGALRNAVRTQRGSVGHPYGGQPNHGNQTNSAYTNVRG